ncbi:hypothetical protein CDAR_308511 [Caerostris darwini]|uniref:Uncharacterized protein n=1 Tax=Caerostris darwini TaxID=1538125 RepID=A0AAV4S163_9ARAC|nr:hypothetical protein CDAR_308511 [Caerostris darwini]
MLKRWGWRVASQIWHWISQPKVIDSYITQEKRHQIESLKESIRMAFILYQKGISSFTKASVGQKKLVPLSIKIDLADQNSTKRGLTLLTYEYFYPYLFEKRTFEESEDDCILKLQSFKERATEDYFFKTPANDAPATKLPFCSFPGDKAAEEGIFLAKESNLLRKA